MSCRCCCIIWCIGGLCIGTFGGCWSDCWWRFGGVGSGSLYEEFCALTTRSLSESRRELFAVDVFGLSLSVRGVNGSLDHVTQSDSWGYSLNIGSGDFELTDPISSIEGRTCGYIQRREWVLEITLRMERISTNLKLIKVVAEENVAVALEKSVHARRHHFPRTRLDAREMEAGKARSRHSKRFVATSALLIWKYISPLKLRTSRSCNKSSFGSFRWRKELLVLFNALCTSSPLI